MELHSTPTYRIRFKSWYIAWALDVDQRNGTSPAVLLATTKRNEHLGIHEHRWIKALRLTQHGRLPWLEHARSSPNQSVLQDISSQCCEVVSPFFGR